MAEKKRIDDNEIKGFTTIIDKNVKQFRKKIEMELKGMMNKQNRTIEEIGMLLRTIGLTDGEVTRYVRERTPRKFQDRSEMFEQLKKMIQAKGSIPKKEVLAFIRNHGIGNPSVYLERFLKKNPTMIKTRDKVIA